MVNFFAAFITGFVLAYAKSWRLALALSAMLPCIGITGAIMNKFISAYKQCVFCFRASSIAYEPFHLGFPSIMWQKLEPLPKRLFQPFVLPKRLELRRYYRGSTTSGSATLFALISKSRQFMGELCRYSSSSFTPDMHLVCNLTLPMLMTPDFRAPNL